MKKTKKFIMLFVTSSFLSSCFFQRFDNNLPYEKIDVQMSYENGRSNLALSKEFDLKKHTIYNKNNLSKIEKDFYVGDQLLVYYRNNAVDHVLVDPCDYLNIKLNHGFEPGSNKLAFYVDEDGIGFNDTMIKYIINKDGSYSDLSTAEDNAVLFGVYREKDIDIRTYGDSYVHKLIYLLAVYSYDINRCV